GAWPGWTGLQPKAVVALSPYTSPFVRKGTLAKLRAPVMFQGGTKDNYITPTVSRPGGAYEQANSPKVFVNFEGAGHGAWTSLDRGSHTLIEKY
ncbi:hypothetical protein NL493_28325, partial [Klebsiella pneumoniae]|nr:hypothetical protein [Klebsiella pneumoniae]